MYKFVFPHEHRQPISSLFCFLSGGNTIIQHLSNIASELETARISVTKKKLINQEMHLSCTDVLSNGKSDFSSDDSTPAAAAIVSPMRSRET